MASDGSNVAGAAVAFSSPPRSQTLFGNAVRETPFRDSCADAQSRRETEFREIGSQTEFGNQMKMPR